jgi:hypothetical protein
MQGDTHFKNKIKAFNAYTLSKYRSDEIESYIVNISESKYLYIIKFHTPWKQLVLGGGSGFYHIDKHTMKTRSSERFSNCLSKSKPTISLMGFEGLPLF